MKVYHCITNTKSKSCFIHFIVDISVNLYGVHFTMDSTGLNLSSPNRTYLLFFCKVDLVIVLK